MPVVAGSPLVHARGLVKEFGRLVAVDGIDFDVQRGEAFGFLGPNGAGKSTTMRVLLGLDAPDAGRALVNGSPYHELGWPPPMWNTPAWPRSTRSSVRDASHGANVGEAT